MYGGVNPAMTNIESHIYSNLATCLVYGGILFYLLFQPLKKQLIPNRTLAIATAIFTGLKAISKGSVALLYGIIRQVHAADVFKYHHAIVRISGIMNAVTYLFLLAILLSGMHSLFRKRKCQK